MLRELGAALLLASVVGCAPPSSSAEPQPGPPAAEGASAAGAMLAAASEASETQALGALPAGRGRITVMTSCMVCHGVGIIVQQRKDAAAWTRTIRQMVGWGAPLPAGEEEALAAYLAEHFGPTARPAP